MAKKSAKKNKQDGTATVTANLWENNRAKSPGEMAGKRASAAAMSKAEMTSVPRLTSQVRGA
jgi:hypothetical protein